VQVRDAGVDEPTLSLERHVSDMAQHNQAAEPVAGAWVAAFPAVLADAVNDDEMSAVDANADAVAVHDTDPAVGGVAREDLLDE
jgi:hypothetical protein